MKYDIMEYEIVESKGITTIYLGMKLSELRKFIEDSPLHITSEEVEFDINQVLNLNNGISIYLDSDLKIYKLSFSNTMFHWRNLRTGDLLRKLKSQARYLLFDDFDRVFFLKGIKGICFETINKNFDINDALEMSIDFITVYPPELDEKNYDYELDEINLETGVVDWS